MWTTLHFSTWALLMRPMHTQNARARATTLCLVDPPTSDKAAPNVTLAADELLRQRAAVTSAPGAVQGDGRHARHSSASFATTAVSAALGAVVAFALASGAFVNPASVPPSHSWDPPAAVAPFLGTVPLVSRRLGEILFSASQAVSFGLFSR